ncbi:MAG: glycerophosphodiester phosphodiesterase family protein [Pseudoruegeria sp.]
MISFPQLDAFRGGNGITRVIGHRGARGVMPENTMEGFKFTIDVGIDALEFDVILTRDRIPVITHNHYLLGAATREPNGRWITGEEPKVSRLTLKELQTFDVGGLDGNTVYGQRFADQVFLNDIRIPRLSELLDLAASPGMEGVHLLLELKSDPEAIDDKNERADVVQHVVDEVRARRLESRTILHSFDWLLLDECRKIAPDMPTSYLSQLPESSEDPSEETSITIGPNYKELTTSLPRAVKEAGGQMWCPYFEDVTADLVAEAHDLGLLVTTWTANEASDIDKMMDAGVDGIVSDHVGRVQRCILNRGQRWVP